MIRDTMTRAKKRVDDLIRRGMIEHARKWIFERGMSLASKALQRYLGITSLVPTRVSYSLLCNPFKPLLNFLVQNAFSERLSSLGFDFHSMLVPDLLHEFELGVWKAVFTHLIRILYAAGGDSIQALNWR